MAKSKPPRVQHLARKILREARSVDFVTKYRMTEMMKMHTNLMGSSTMQPALDKTGPLARPNDAIPGFGRPSAQRSGAHSLSMNRVSSDFFFDYTSWLA